MIINSEKDLEGMKRVSEVAARILREMRLYCRPGISTKELDIYGAKLMKSEGARSAPLLAYRFPGFTCISVNEVAAHGIPSDRVILRDGDLVNIDVSVELGGFWADNGGSFVLGDSLQAHDELVDASKNILQEAIARIRHGYRLSALGGFIEQKAAALGYLVIKNLTGHGVGRSLHEEPREIANFREMMNFRRFKEGQVVAIETFISTKSNFAVTQPDGWSLVGNHGGFVAQHEHTLVVTKSQPLILTAENGIWD
ncbi:MAG: type I methionyl aminopeptidase [Saprospiraceae bacterium]|nr:type I methionyl aminopeptidase [Saprospiraceae bacterium]